MQTPVVKKRRGISPIWILPFIALCIGGWLLYRGITERSIDIIVHFHSAEGVTPGKTKVMFKGIPVGVVKKITVDKGLDTVSMHIAISPEAKDGLSKDLKFWIVRPEIAAGKISGLNTIFSGSYIAVQPGTSKEFCTEFMGLDEPPPVPDNAPGLHIKLKTDALHSIQKGSPIYYRNIKVGSVQDYEFEGDNGILISAYIEPMFTKMVKPASRFWNVSGLTLSGGLSGVKVHMESLSTLISGGIAFGTPDAFKNQEPARNGQVYKLYSDFEAAEYGINVTLQLEAGEGMVEGMTKVIFRGIEVGRIKKISFNPANSKYKVTAHLFMDPMAESMLRKGTRFWVIRPNISMAGVNNLDTLVSGPYITFMPGGGTPCYEFKVQGSHSKPILKDGVFYRLAATDIRSISPGTPVLFKHIQVGEISRYKLNKDNSVDLIFLIYEDYRHLVNDKCVFWNYSGINLKVTPVALKLNADSLQAIVSGGVVFDYPHKHYGKKLKAAKPGRRFTLFDSYSDAVAHNPELKPRGLLFKLHSKDPIYVTAGSPIYYNRVQIGEVTGVTLDSEREQTIIDAFVKEKYSDLVKTTSRFFNMGGITIAGSLRSGMAVKAPPVASVIIGGIGLINPEPGQKVKGKRTFRLFNNRKAALEKDYIPLSILFSHAEEISENTEIRYHGVNIGYVKTVDIEDDMRTVKAECLIKPHFAHLFKNDTVVWLVTPEISISGIRNARTVITGPYITLVPGKGAPCRTLTARITPPAVDTTDTGLNIVVEAPKLGSIKRGDPVYYRQLKVGTVTGYRLAKDARSVWIYLNIREQYAPIVRTGTRFWNVSGIRVDAGIFSGVDIDTESIEAIVAGGIAFATPEDEEMGTPVESGHHFKLYEEADDDWIEWRPKIRL